MKYTIFGIYPPLMCGVYNVSDVSLIRVIQSGHIVSAGAGPRDQAGKSQLENNGFVAEWSDDTRP